MKQRLLRRTLTLCCACILAFVLPASAALFGNGSTQEAVAVAAFAKSGLSTDIISFSADDFRVSGNARLASILVDSLPDPSAGMLTIPARSPGQRDLHVRYERPKVHSPGHAYALRHLLYLHPRL